MSTTMTTNTTPLNEADARELTDQIAEGLADVHSLIVQAWEGRVWEALGFETWDAWIDANFRGLQLRPPREQREEVVLSMREAGMSMRAISQATDLSYGTVNRSARSGDPNGSPERDSNVVGLDGKSNKRPAPTAEDAAEFADVSLDGLGIPMVDPTSLPGVGADQVLSGDVLDPEPASNREPVRAESAWWEEPRQALLEAESRCAALLRQRKAEPRLTEDPQDPGPSQLTMAAARTVLAAGGVIGDLEDADDDEA